MTAKENTRGGWFRRALLGVARLGRPRPYWGRRLEDKLERPDSFFSWATAFIFGMQDLVIGVVAFGLLISALGVVLVGPIFLSPGLLEVGLADPIGRGLAAVCLSSGNCDLPYLLGGAALAVPMLLAVVMTGLISLRVAFASERDEAEVNEDELFEALGALDERIVRLRADLVLAGVLKVSAEEQAEQDEEAADERA